MRVFFHEVASRAPEGGEAPRVVEYVHVEAVDEVVVTKEGEGVIGYVAEEVYVWFHAPVVVVLGESGMFVEEAAVPAAHVAVREHPAFSYADGA